MRDILVASLDGAKLFILTDNPDRADATLRGAAEDLVLTEVHTSSDSLNARTNFGSGRTTRSWAEPMEASALARTSRNTRRSVAMKPWPPCAS